MLVANKLCGWARGAVKIRRRCLEGDQGAQLLDQESKQHEYWKAVHAVTYDLSMWQPTLKMGTGHPQNHPQLDWQC